MGDGGFKSTKVKGREKENWDFFARIPEYDRRQAKSATVKGSQLLQPLFEFSGACSGCGETPYLKLVSQLFGDRMIVANATGCSSIYGGNLPTTPWSKNADGRGPAWSNSLFEDNAEFGLGMRLAADQHVAHAAALLQQLLAGVDRSEARQLLSIADLLVKKSVWIIGGDGWAYDIGFGGLDHVLASGRNVNVLAVYPHVLLSTPPAMRLPHRRWQTPILRLFRYGRNRSLRRTRSNV